MTRPRYTEPTYDELDRAMTRAEAVRSAARPRQWIEIARISDRLIREMNKRHSGVSDFCADLDADALDLANVTMAFWIAEQTAGDEGSPLAGLAATFLALVEELKEKRAAG